MKRADFRFFHRLRVRWVEVDMQKIVFNGHYLMYFDTAVADYWRALALPYEEAMHQLGGDLYVKKSTLEYFASARYDDSLDVAMRCAKIGNSSMLFEGGIYHGEKLLVSGELLYVYANPETQTSQRVPDALRALLEGFERGESMTRTQIGTWQELETDAAAVRTEVFVQEQGIAREDEWDAADKTARHAVVYNRMNMPLATGRLLVAAPGVGKIGRMAAKRVLRGSHLGKQVLDALTNEARARGDHEVWLHAQQSAAGFYEKSGFNVRGEPFEEVGIAHIEMFKTL
ncbi:MAG TPA: YbgC/FadM family acyl-CoA thioesterase [Burkholderiaceae bacterium]|nr:YbgC/FadM family acyl-CoA thioesterase [Burkholderiaceae bacterium]